MSEQHFTFKKGERLCNRNVITELFQYDGDHKITEYPFLVKWLPSANLKTTFPAQILITVSRKFSRKATERNRVRRQLRELYRSNKPKIYERLQNNGTRLAILLIYVGKHEIDFRIMKDKFNILVERLVENIERNS